MHDQKTDDSNLKLSAVTLGVWQLGDAKYWGETEDARALVAGALDHGITTFDTAEGYGAGKSEQALGRALGADRDRAVIVSKVASHHCAPNDLRAACEQSLQNLRTDRIDLYLVHWPNHEIPFADTFGAMADLRNEGKIRHIGLSNFGVQDLGDWLDGGDAAANQLHYSLLTRAIENEIVPACRKHNIGIMAYMPLFQGILTGRWRTVGEIPPPRRRTRHFAAGPEAVRHDGPGCEELLMSTLSDLIALSTEVDIPLADLAIAWLLTRPAVATVIVGASRVDQVQKNAAVAALELPDGVTDRLDQITSPLEAELGPCADLWMHPGKSRIR